MPAYGFFVRHVKGLELSDVQVTYEKDEARPPFAVEQARDVSFVNVKAKRSQGTPAFVLRDVENFSTHRVQGVADTTKDKVGDEKY